MTEETKQVPTYRLGDTIKIVLDVSDRSGVEEVRANFVLITDVTRDFTLHAEAQGQHNASLVLEVEVTENMAPGEYYCQYVALYDTKGNKSLVSRPGIELYIEDIPGDHEGPKLESWHYG